MKITLSLDDDTELRKHIHEMICGQVRAIAREEIRLLIEQEVRTKIEQMKPWEISERRMRELAERTIAEQVRGFGDFRGYVRNVVTEMVGTAIGIKQGGAHE